MKNRFVTFATTALLALGAGSLTAHAAPVQLFADSAPNVFGSPDFAPWWQNAKQQVADGTFTNLANGTYPGTNNVAPEDFIVYSYGDLGKRVHWIYWLEGQTVENLDGNLEIKFTYDWDGEVWTYDWNTGQSVLDGAELGWTTPGSIENYQGGVIGNFGLAWWAADPDNPNQDWEEFDELRASIIENQSMMEGLVRFREDANADWQVFSMTLNVIPAPAAAPLLAACMALVGVRRRRRG